MKEDYWNNKVFDKYVEGTNMEGFQHIKEISHYNWNYYVGFGSDLLFGKSDDDNTTEWYLIRGNEPHFFIGLSFVTNREKLVFESNK